MSFFDTVKAKVGDLASDAGRAGRVTAAQARLVVLQNDLRKAERELGHDAFALIERGDVDHPDLAGPAARLREILAEVRGKEAEIAAQRGTAMSAAQPAEPAAGPAATTTATAERANVAGTTVQVVPAADLPGTEAAAETATPEPAKPSAKAPTRKPATKAASKTTARKPAAKKAARAESGAGKPAAKKPAAKPAAKRAVRPAAAKKAARPKADDGA